MNILYFGPYKDIFEHGIPSRSVIGSLAKKCQSGLSIRNILLTPHTGGVSSLLPPNISSDHSTSPDIIIQHVPVDHLSYPRKNSGTINAAIPMDLDISRPNDRLQYFDLILVDEIDKYNILCDKFSSDKVKLFRYEYDIVSKGTYDLKLYANTKKFYFVNDYINNQHTIQKIIIAFNLAFRSNQDVGLFLCFNDQNQYNKEIRTFIDCIVQNYFTRTRGHIPDNIQISELKKLSSDHKKKLDWSEITTSYNQSNLIPFKRT